MFSRHRANANRKLTNNSAETTRIVEGFRHRPLFSWSSPFNYQQTKPWVGRGVYSIPLCLEKGQKRKALCRFIWDEESVLSVDLLLHLGRNEIFLQQQSVLEIIRLFTHRYMLSLGCFDEGRGLKRGRWWYK